jgi:menaquinone-9 beta-reductase
MTTDVLIVGGGPAGLAAALALRKRGASVTVADSMRPPIDKACGEGLMPDSLRALAELGVELTARDGAVFHGIRFVEGHTQATAPFPSGGETGSEAGIGLRRQSLHARLAAAAEASGVTLRWQSPVQLPANRLERQDGQALVAGAPTRYKWLIGADGQGSRVRLWAGLEPGQTASRRFGFRRHFQVEPWSPFVEVHWAPGGQAYVTPTGPREVCIAAVVRNPHHRIDHLLAEMPRLREKLGSAVSDTPLDQERGALTTTRQFDCVAQGRVALIGDASGSADAITGEGMGMAFRQALLLAECLESGDLASYNQQHPRILQLAQTMARILLLMDRSPAFRARALGLLAAEPALFARLLGVHLGTETITSFAARQGLKLAWGLALRQILRAPAASAAQRH